MDLRPATEADALYIADNLRQADLLEVTAASGAHPVDSLLQGVRLGPSLVWLDDAGRPCVLFGAVPLDEITASIWLVGTQGMDAHKRHLLRHARPWVDAFNMAWPLLVNSADVRNALHLRFIKWCGFTFINQRSVNGLRFLDFARIRNRPIVRPCVPRGCDLRPRRDAGRHQPHSRR
jgi:hypothetical protein